MKNIRFWILILSTVLVLAVAAIIYTAWPARKIRIAYLPIYVDLPLFVAKEQHLFEKKGLDIEMVRFEKSPEIGIALANNDVDFAASVAFATVLQNESRDPDKLKIFIIDSETPERYLSSFVVLADSGIKSMADLKGKTLASFPGPTAETFCKMVLEKNGIDPAKDLKFLSIDVGSHLDVLSSHTVDALFTYEPTATQAVLEKKAIKLLPGAVEREIINPWQAGVWVVRNKFAEKHDAETRKIIAVLYEAIDQIRENPLEAKVALSNHTSIRQAVARETPDIPFAKRWEADFITLQKHADILTQRKVISKRIDVMPLIAPEAWTATQP